MTISPSFGIVFRPKGGFFMSLNYKEMVHVNGILKQGIEKIKYYKFFETDSKVRMNDNDLLEYLADTLNKKIESTTNEDKYILKL